MSTDFIPDKTFDQAQVIPDHKDAKIEALEEDLQKAKDALKEERFCWVLILFVLFDAFFFSFMGNWAGPLAITVLELLVLIVMGRNLGVNEPKILVMKFLDGRNKKH